MNIKDELYEVFRDNEMILSKAEVDNFIESLYFKDLRLVEVDKGESGMNDKQKIELGEKIIKTAMSELGFCEATPDNFIVIADIALNKIHELEDPEPNPNVKRADVGLNHERPIDPDKQKKADEIAEKLGLKETPLEGFEKMQKMFESDKVSPRPTPNCSICQWRSLEAPPFTMFKGHTKHPQHYVCDAQGERYIKNVYGNKLCKRLFQTEPTAGPLPTDEAA